MNPELDDAGRITLQHLLGALDPHQRTMWTYEDACITAHRIGNRYGVPADATTWRYQITYPENGAWTVHVRAVWRQKKLFRPQTHVVTLSYDDDEDLHDGAVGVHALFSEWLSGVPLEVL